MFKNVLLHYFYMRTLFIYTTPHFSHGALAKKLGISNSIKTPDGGPFSFPIIGKFLSSGKIQPKIEDIAPNVILTESTTKDLLAAVKYKKKHKKTKIVSIVADPKLYNINNFIFFDKNTTLDALKYVDWFLCCSHMIKDCLPADCQKRASIFLPKLSVKPNKLSADFGLRHNFYFAGTLVPSKGIKEMAEFFKNNSKYLLHVFGDGIDKYRLGGSNIKYHGYKKFPADKMVDFVGFNISFAKFEPFGVVALEAMMNGIIPIVSDKCGNKEIVSRLDPRLVCSSPEDVIKIHEYIIRDKKTFNDYSKRAKQIAEEYLQDSKNSYTHCYNNVRMNIFCGFLYKTSLF